MRLSVAIGGPKSVGQYAWQTSASGLAGVWSRDNTREGIWDALARREVFATTGTRLRVRVFAGWDFLEEGLARSDFAKHGYRNGVPMGGDLKGPTDGRSPRFMVRALRDLDGANLDRIQIIKGWLDADGETREQNLRRCVFKRQGDDSGEPLREKCRRQCQR